MQHSPAFAQATQAIIMLCEPPFKRHRQGADSTIAISSRVPLAGINCGVMLIRNTEWAAAFLADVGQYAYMHRDTIEEYMRPVPTCL